MPKAAKATVATEAAVAVAAVVGVGWFLACGLPLIACPSWRCRINGVMVSPPIKTQFARQMHFLVLRWWWGAW